MKFLTTTDGVRELIEADSAQDAAHIAERNSEGAAQVICIDRFGPVETTNWPFPSSSSPAPLPWRFDWVGGRPAIVDANGQPVAFVESTRGKFELEKVNAQHAALCVNAHDDLLEALELFVRPFEGDHIEAIKADYGDGTANRIKAGRAAIAKARGQS